MQAWQNSSSKPLLAKICSIDLLVWPLWRVVTKSISSFSEVFIGVYICRSYNFFTKGGNVLAAAMWTGNVLAAAMWTGNAEQATFLHL